ncbi:hypothetical protein DFH11DRAFT_1730146 [Phellopilus nigrolimitatus]|nr:hypothetical protein DFH11DRAFT_1730146 [Phellopilus nigrolimitatus]
MASTVNVVRYSALLEAKNEERAHHALHEREALVKQAKEAWKRQQEGPKDSIITNPDDPKFDLEKLISKWEKDLQ